MEALEWPDSVVDLALALIPLLEEVTAVLLMSGVHLGQVDHLCLELILPETLVHEEIVLFVHGAVAALARAREDLEPIFETTSILGTATKPEEKNEF